VSVRRQVAAAACAAGLALAGSTTASAAKLGIVQRPAERFERAIDAHVERVEQRAQQRAEPRAERREAATPSVESLGVSQATLDAIASCESGGDPTAVNPAGYYGKYQFDLGTWASVGGSGSPAEAPEAEQDYRAALLYSRAGASPWPICGA
jgi:soluble lytic murein transglycosylase-like protein